MKRFNKAVMIVASLLVLAGCRSKAILGGTEVNQALSAKQVVRNHSTGATDFQFLSGKLGIDYSDGKESSSVSVSLRMKKDEIIWLSAPLGVVKVYITPTRVSYYNKLQNEYFDGDFEFLSGFLGTEIDFPKLQNLLLGQAIVDLGDGKYELDFTSEAYRLTPRNADVFSKMMFLVEPQNFKLAAQMLAQPMQKRAMEVQYKSYQKVATEVLPQAVAIDAVSESGTVSIAIDYRQLELNRELRFPYRIPNGYTDISAE
ncbi:protein of unknown function [Robiginitalea myxolifaciens]|uniref:DUF4292 domain-containing protein n=1 Tax=Robiginitalea myxolifaciens TaxID=400055 RepID=A0A1I6G1R7_9FLAO|nr:DUF4292 domain-containing protein [Robiginitalea myxolifaciens]SFR36135.1 protein of unknown function [Robiginitalea myxolifaciens]